MSTIKLQDVCKRYDNTTVIPNINLDIDDGEFIVIVGPSGCGKSTLLRMVAGLETISEGKLLIDNKLMNRVPPKNRDIAMVFQNYALYYHMSVYDNMAYGLKIRGFNRAEIHKRVLTAAKTLHLEHLLERKTRALSGGQRQRVAMGRAIVRQPKAFLFDEPLSNLDAALRVKMRLKIKHLQQRYNTTSIYVTHDQVEAMTLAHRLVVMNNGIPEQIGSPLDIYNRPATEFVAGFIGSPAMNFMPVTVERDHLLLDKQAKLILPKAFHNLPQKTLTLGIRPEHIQLYTEKHEDDAITFSSYTNTIESLGSDTLVYGHLGNHDILLTLRLPGHWQPTSSSELQLHFPPEHIHLFDPESGLRILPQP